MWKRTAFDSVRCPVCKSADTEMLLEMPSVPVYCNVLSRSPDEARAMPRGEMRLLRCRVCGHGWNEAFDPALVDYRVEYENSLHYSDIFNRYVQDLARELAARHRLAGGFVVEIGCGRGDFLASFCAAAKCRGVGFDPSLTRQTVAPPDGIQLVADVFRASYLEDSFDFVICRHVLEHLAEPEKLLGELAASLPSGSKAYGYFEVPNFDWLVENEAIWDVIYEHCQYFTQDSLAQLFEVSGYQVLRVSARYGGQYLGVEGAFPGSGGGESAADDSAGRTSSALPGRRAAGKGLERDAILERWRAIVSDVRRRKETVLLWGAGSKAVMFANMLNLSPDELVVVDVNPRKRGKYVSGTGARIEGPEILSTVRPQLVLVANSRYADEIRATLAEYGHSPELVCLT